MHMNLPLSIKKVNVQGICDAHSRFLSVTANNPGSVHDSTMFKNSAIGKKIAAGEFGDGFLLGDSGYGCTPYLLTPYNDPITDEEVICHSPPLSVIFSLRSQ